MGERYFNLMEYRNGIKETLQDITKGNVLALTLQLLRRFVCLVAIMDGYK